MPYPQLNDSKLNDILEVVESRESATAYFTTETLCRSGFVQKCVSFEVTKEFEGFRTKIALMFGCRRR